MEQNKKSICRTKNFISKQSNIRNRRKSISNKWTRRIHNTIKTTNRGLWTKRSRSTRRIYINRTWRKNGKWNIYRRRKTISKLQCKIKCNILWRPSSKRLSNRRRTIQWPNARRNRNNKNRRILKRNTNKRRWNNRSIIWRKWNRRSRIWNLCKRRHI